MIHARLGEREPALSRGDEVILVEYDGRSELFLGTAAAAHGGAAAFALNMSRIDAGKQPEASSPAAPATSVPQVPRGT